MAIARRAEAFGMSIAYTSRNAKAEAPYPYFASAEALAREVDFLVVITPGGAGTRKPPEIRRTSSFSAPGAGASRIRVDLRRACSASIVPGS